MCGGFAAGALAVLTFGLVAAIYKRVVEALAVLAADFPASIYKQMFALRSYFRLKRPVDEGANQSRRNFLMF